MGSDFMKRGEFFLFLLCIIISLIVLSLFSYIPMLSFLAGFSLLMMNYYLFKWLFLSKRKRWLVFGFFIFKIGLNLFLIFLAMKFLAKMFFIAGVLTFPFFLAFSFLILYFISHEWRAT